MSTKKVATNIESKKDEENYRKLVLLSKFVKAEAEKSNDVAKLRERWLKACDDLSLPATNADDVFQELVMCTICNTGHSLKTKSVHFKTSRHIRMASVASEYCAGLCTSTASGARTKTKPTTTVKIEPKLVIESLISSVVICVMCGGAIVVTNEMTSTDVANASTAAPKEEIVQEKAESATLAVTGDNDDDKDEASAPFIESPEITRKKRPRRAKK